MWLHKKEGESQKEREWEKRELAHEIYFSFMVFSIPLFGAVMCNSTFCICYVYNFPILQQTLNENVYEYIHS